MGIFDTLKDAATLVQKADNIELYRVLLQVQQDALSLVQEKHDLMDANRALNQEVESLRSKLAFAGTLVRRQGVYFAEGDPDPFCPKCWEVNRLAVHIGHRNDGHSFCRQCESWFTGLATAN